MQSKKIAVLGGGSWGTIISQMLSASGHSVNLWARSNTFIKHIQTTGRFTRPIEINLPDSIHLYTSLNEALKDVSLVICAIPSEGVSGLIEQIKSLIENNPSINIPCVLSATKGLDKKAGKTMVELWEENFNCPVAVLSGPNLAAEAGLAKPMKTIIGARSINTAAEIANYFQLNHFKIQVSTDVIGIEICGAAKNVIAIAAGAWDGLGMGTSGKGAMLTKALDDLANLVCIMGGDKTTTYSVAGIGDLYITCSSTLSRNYQTGFVFAQGKNLSQIKTDLKGQIAEGIWTTPLIHEIALKHKTEFKVCEAVYEMLKLNLALPEDKYKLEEMFIDLV
jgi:glycerol-3-phosphate dehydrogenase (NAD(P)+)